MATPKTWGCYNCMWFSHVREDLGHCHRFPPQVVPHTKETAKAKEPKHALLLVWPEVAKDDYCGEFSYKGNA